MSGKVWKLSGILNVLEILSGKCVENVWKFDEHIIQPCILLKVRKCLLMSVFH